MEKRGRGRPKKPKSLREQADEIKARAKEAGLETNYFFVTTFDRYLNQLDILEKLEKSIKGKDTLIEQNYNGRANTVLNPAIRAYNSTTDSANKTVSTLMRIINGFSDSKDESDDDPLLKIINGGE